MALAGILAYISAAWMLWIVPSLLLYLVTGHKEILPKLVTDLMEYGKLRDAVKKKKGGAASWGCLNRLSVPKRWFTHFYVHGSLWILAITAVYFSSSCVSVPFHTRQIPILDNIISYITRGFLHQKCGPSLPVQQQHVDVAMVLSMLSVQVLRRLYECICISKFSNATMHLGHYILGLFFYPAAAFTALTHLDSSKEHTRLKSAASPSIQWYHMAALVLFLWASYHQHTCHKILAHLREKNGNGNNNSNQEKYGQPNGDWFELVSCPHFLAEILIYSALTLCLVPSNISSRFLLVLLHVVTSLSLSARQCHVWNKRTFQNYPSNRFAIIPWIF